MKYSKLQIHRVTAELLAKTLIDLFPRSQILDSGATQIGYFCEFQLSQPLDDQAIMLIEEGMQRLIQSRVSIESVEMMAGNAATLFKHNKQFLLADQLAENPKLLLELLRIDDYYGICPGPYPSDTREIGVVKLLKYESGEQSCIRGVVFPDRKQLKAFVRQSKQLRSLDHMQLGKELDLFSVEDGVCNWHPLGEKLRERMIFWWKQSHRDLGYGCYHTHFSGDKFVAYLDQMQQPPVMAAQIRESKTGEKRFSDSGLFQLFVETQDCAIAFVDEKKSLETIISYLQFIKKTVNMISIDCKWVRSDQKSHVAGSQKSWDQRVSLLSQACFACEIEPKLDVEPEKPMMAPGIELLFIDSFGNEWPGPKVELFESKKIRFSQQKYPYVVKSTFFRSLERVVALLVEANAGKIPAWFNYNSVDS